MNSSELWSMLESELTLLGSEMLVEAERWRYVNDAYFMFARLSGGIPDSTSEATEASITIGVDEAELHSSILRITSARRASDGGAIEILNTADMDRFAGRTGRGPVNYLLVGEQAGVGRWIDVPAANDTARLTIYRTPLKKITGPSQKLDEIDEMHHLALLDWLKYLVAKRPGTSYFNPQMAADYAGVFRGYCAQVKGELERAKYRNRTVRYGGI